MRKLKRSKIENNTKIERNKNKGDNKVIILTKLSSMHSSKFARLQIVMFLFVLVSLINAGCGDEPINGVRLDDSALINDAGSRRDLMSLSLVSEKIRGTHYIEQYGAASYRARYVGDNAKVVDMCKEVKCTKKRDAAGESDRHTEESCASDFPDAYVDAVLTNVDDILNEEYDTSLLNHFRALGLPNNFRPVVANGEDNPAVVSADLLDDAGCPLNLEELDPTNEVSDEILEDFESDLLLEAGDEIAEFMAGKPEFIDGEVVYNSLPDSPEFGKAHCAWLEGTPYYSTECYDPLLANYKRCLSTKNRGRIWEDCIYRLDE